jgi:ketosteroid isomerase-like protein
VRLDESTDWDELDERIAEAWERTAPPKLVIARTCGETAAPAKRASPIRKKSAVVRKKRPRKQTGYPAPDLCWLGSCTFRIGAARPPSLADRHGRGGDSMSAEEFQQFMQEREAAARAYVSGDAKPVLGLTASSSPATFFGPRGGHVEGAEEVAATYERDARAFGPAGESSFQILQAGASNALAFWVGFQDARTHVQGSSGSVSMRLRVTEIFRRDSGSWKLIHRHADSVVPEEYAG